MGKLMAIDFGLKRTGLAVTDELQIIASALATVDSKDLMTYLIDYIKKNEVDKLIVGDPGEDTHNTVPANEFTKALKKQFPDIPVFRFDERFTSVMAKQTMIMSGIGKKKRRDKGIVDRISATLILQGFMNQNDSHEY